MSERGPGLRIGDSDAELGVVPVFLSVARADLIYVKVLLESFEGIGVMRSEEPFYGDDRALIVLLIVPDAAADAEAVLGDASQFTDLRVETVTHERLQRLRDDLLGELGEPRKRQVSSSSDSKRGLAKT